MELSDILKDNSRVYVDTCRLKSLMDTSLKDQEKSKIVVPRQIKDEYIFEGTSQDERDYLDNLEEQSIHKLAHERGFGTYFVANKIFKAISLEDLKEDLDNRVHSELNKSHTKYAKSQFKGDLIKKIMQLGLACTGFVGLTHLSASSDKNLPVLDYFREKGKLEYDSAIENLREQMHPEELSKGLQRDRKKKKRWIKRNMESVKDKFGTRDDSRNEGRDYSRLNACDAFNYNDSDLITSAMLDSAIKNQDVGIYTSDKDFLDKMSRIKEIFGTNAGQNKLNLYFQHPVTNELEIQQVGIPNDASELYEPSRKFIESGLEKMNSHTKDLINKIERYTPISRSYELAEGVLAGGTGIACLAAIPAIGKFGYQIAENWDVVKMTGDAYSLYGQDGDLIKLAMTGAILGSMTLTLPFITKNLLKKSAKCLKTAIKYPNVE